MLAVRDAYGLLEVVALAPSKLVTFGRFRDDDETRDFVRVFNFYSVCVYRCHACILSEIRVSGKFFLPIK